MAIFLHPCCIFEFCSILRPNQVGGKCRCVPYRGRSRRAASTYRGLLRPHIAITNSDMRISVLRAKGETESLLVVVLFNRLWTKGKSRYALSQSGANNVFGDFFVHVVGNEVRSDGGPENVKRPIIDHEHILLRLVDDEIDILSTDILSTEYLWMSFLSGKNVNIDIDFITDLPSKGWCLGIRPACRQPERRILKFDYSVKIQVFK